MSASTHNALFCIPGMNPQMETGYYDLDSKKWVTLSTRDATPAELGMKPDSVISHRSTTPMSSPTETGISGSYNSHARLSPSSSKCWSNCTAAPSFLAANAHRIAPDKSSVYAEQGTAAHEWAAKVLLNQIAVADIPEEFMPYVGDYVNHCLALVPEGVTPMIEVSVPLFYPADKPGTCDFAVVSNERVIIRDYKHGAGELVEVEGNPQLAIYGYSLIVMLEDVYDFTDDTVVDLHAYQPRHREAEDLKPWVLTLGEFRAFCKEIEYRAIQAKTGLDRVLGKLPCGERNISVDEILEAAPMVKFNLKGCNDGACRWRGARSLCSFHLAGVTEGTGTPERSGAEMIALLPDLSKEELKQPVDERIVTTLDGVIVTDDYLVKLYARNKAIRRFLDDVEEFLEARVLAGEKIEGVKLVEGRAGNRAWKDEAAADTFLKGQGFREDGRYNFKLKSPTEMEKALAEKLKKSTRTANRFAELVSRSAPQRVLALASDKREAVGAAIDALPVLDAPDEWEP